MDKPSTIDSLLEASPLGMLRLKLAWSGLTVSEKCHVVGNVLEPKAAHMSAPGLLAHVEEFLDLALADPHPYVRYVAASHIREPYIHDNKPTKHDLAAMARFAKVINDNDPLVRAAHGQDRELFGLSILSRRDGIAQFWEREHPRRLIEINNERGDNGAEVAAALVYATETLLPAGKVTVEMMLDVLLQYLSGSSLAAVLDKKAAHDDFFVDGWGRYSSGKDIEALWAAIPKLPRELQQILVQALPNDAGMNKDMAAKVAELLDPFMLSCLLWRDDIPLPAVRAKFFSEAESENLRAAAMSSRHFVLPDEVISQQVYRLDEPVEGGKAKYSELKDLMLTCGGASLAQHFLLMYLVKKAVPFYNFSGPWDDLALARDGNERRFAKLDSHAKAKELFDLRLAMLAVDVAPIGEEKPSEWRLQAITDRSLVVPGDPWQTFLKLKATLSEKTHKAIVGELPNTPFDDEPATEEDVQDISDEPTPDSKEARLNAVQAYFEVEIAAIKDGLATVQVRTGILFWLTVAVLAIILYSKL